MNNTINNNENNDEYSIKPNAATHIVLLNAIVKSNVGGEIAEKYHVTCYIYIILN